MFYLKSESPRRFRVFYLTKTFNQKSQVCVGKEKLFRFLDSCKEKGHMILAVHELLLVEEVKDESI